jgi:hypothetical protein
MYYILYITPTDRYLLGLGHTYTPRYSYTLGYTYIHTGLHIHTWVTHTHTYTNIPRYSGMTANCFMRYCTLGVKTSAPEPKPAMCVCVCCRLVCYVLYVIWCIGEGRGTCDSESGGDAFLVGEPLHECLHGGGVGEAYAGAPQEAVARVEQWQRVVVDA